SPSSEALSSSPSAARAATANGDGSPAWHSASSASVRPACADTTATTCRPSARQRAISVATTAYAVALRSTEPPNFSTITPAVIGASSLAGSTAQAWRRAMPCSVLFDARRRGQQARHAQRPRRGAEELARAGIGGRIRGEALQGIGGAELYQRLDRKHAPLTVLAVQHRLEQPGGVRVAAVAERGDGLVPHARAAVRQQRGEARNAVRGLQPAERADGVAGNRRVGTGGEFLQPRDRRAVRRR